MEHKSFKSTSVGHDSLLVHYNTSENLNKERNKYLKSNTECLRASLHYIPLSFYTLNWHVLPEFCVSFTLIKTFSP